MAEVGKPGSTTTRLAADDREAKRLAGLQRDAMDDDAGLAEPRRRPGSESRPRPWRCRRTAARDRPGRALRAATLPARPRRPGQMPSGTGSPPCSSTAAREDGGVGVVDRARADRRRLARRSRRRWRARRRAAGARPRPGDARPPPACRSRARSGACRARSTVSPRARSLPAKPMSWPGRAGRRTSIAPAASSTARYARPSARRRRRAAACRRSRSPWRCPAGPATRARCPASASRH